MISERIHSPRDTEKNYETIHLRFELGLSSEEVECFGHEVLKAHCKGCPYFQTCIILKATNSERYFPFMSFKRVQMTKEYQMICSELTKLWKNSCLLI